MKMVRLASSLVITLSLISASSICFSATKAQSKKQTLETITVTAEKSEENIQKVCASVSALSGEELEQRGVSDTNELVNQIPNMHVIAPGNRQVQFLSIRGIRPPMTTAPTVGVYLDDVSISNLSALDLDLFDIERIEVLRGPQGTLYGRNSMAGVLNIVTKMPGNDFTGKAEIEYGNYAHTAFKGGVSGPLLKDKFFVSVAAMRTTTDGYVDNVFLNKSDVDAQDNLNGRLKLALVPNEAWEIVLSADGYTTDGNWDGFAPLDMTKDHKGQNNVLGKIKTNGDGQSLRLRYKGDFYNFTSISARRHHYSDSSDMDWDGYPVSLLQGDIRDSYDFLSQEFRIASAEEKADGFSKWQLGAYLFNEEDEMDTFFHMKKGMPPFLPPFIQKITNKNESKGLALFGQGTYRFFEKIGLTLGLRYDREKKDNNAIQYYEPDLSFIGMTTRTGSADNSYEEWLPKATLDYEFNRNLMAYVTYAKGYKSGGFNIFSLTGANKVYQPEYSTNYELGFKSSWLDKKLIANVALFYIDLTDQQFEVVNSISKRDIKNAGESHSQGFELEFSALPMPGLQFNAGFGYVEAKFDKYNDGTRSYDGNYLPEAPRYTFNLNAKYEHETGIWGLVELNGVGEYYYNEANTQKQDAYYLVNARTGYKWDNFGLTLWAKNLFDEKYLTRAVKDQMNPTGDCIACAGAPMTFGITLSGWF